MSRGKLIQNGVHLEEHEYKTVKLFLEAGYFLDSVKPNRTQLTFSLTQDNRDKLQRIASQKGMTMAGVLSSWIAN